MGFFQIYMGLYGGGAGIVYSPAVFVGVNRHNIGCPDVCVNRHNIGCPDVKVYN